MRAGTTNKHAGVDHKQEAALLQHLQIQIKIIINTHFEYRYFTCKSHLPPSAQHPRPHKSKQEEGARAWQDLQGQKYSTMHSTSDKNAILIQYLLHVAPCPPPDPRSGQAGEAASNISVPVLVYLRDYLDPKGSIHPPNGLGRPWVDPSPKSL